jgi:hypothetical protein
VLSEKEEGKLEATYMQMLKSMLKIDWRMHKTNAQIRERAGV